jgi:hypothetical protein
MQDKTCIKCTKIAVVVDKGFPLCGDCYFKEYKLGKYEYKKDKDTVSETSRSV